MRVDTALVFDMRAPSFGTPRDQLYSAALEMASFADESGFGHIVISEHHGSDDGYCSSPFVMGAAFAARTRRARITLGAIILPLHDPVKIAEQIAMLDLISGGRLDVALAPGYVPSEFARFNVPLNGRARLMDEGIEIILRALQGERFQSNGREIFVRPLPLQPPHPMLYVAGGREATVHRAVRFGLGLWPLRWELCDLYDRECVRSGRPPGPKFTLGPPMSVHVSEDPDRTWAQIEPFALHAAASYAKWDAESYQSSSPFAGLDDPVKLRASAIFSVVTPEQCVRLALQLASEGKCVPFYPLLGGMPPEVGWRSLRLYATAVLPALKGQPK